MPANNISKIVKDLHDEFPDKIAMLNSPFSFKTPYKKWALDNGCFKKFDEKLYWKTLNKALKFEPPMFVVCPDVVGCHDRTLALWNHYWTKIKNFTWPSFKVAFVAQDGCTPETIPMECDWIFVGGNDPWKDDYGIPVFSKFGQQTNKPVHVGRVNSEKRKNHCELLGVTSVDGSSWLVQRRKTFQDFMAHFKDRQQLSFLEKDKK